MISFSFTDPYIDVKYGPTDTARTRTTTTATTKSITANQYHFIFNTLTKYTNNYTLIPTRKENQRKIYNNVSMYKTFSKIQQFNEDSKIQWNLSIRQTSSKA